MWMIFQLLLSIVITKKDNIVADYPKIYPGLNGKPIQFDQTNFLGKGGEKTAWRVGDVAYGIWHEPSRMPPIEKLKELGAIQHPDIIKPIDLVYEDAKRTKIIGHSMRFVDSDVPLVTLFAKPFKKRNGVDHKKIVDLIRVMHQMLDSIHQANCLAVDWNEMNLLVDNKTWDRLYGIDTPSYQTPNYPATAIMWSIRDPHSGEKWNKETDFYSFAILAFQMLIGHHPFEVRHPDFENIPKANKQRRDAMMLANVSAFNAKSILPRACESIDTIPSALRQWMHAVFEQGIRSIPPVDYEAVVKLTAKVLQVTGGEALTFEKLASLSDDILGYYHSKNDLRVIVLADKAIIDSKNEYRLPHPRCKIAFTTKGSPVAVYQDNENVNLFDIRSQQDISFDCAADNVMVYDGRIFVHNGDTVAEITLTELPTGGILASMPDSSGIMKVLNLPSATKVGDGVIVQNMIGRHYVTFFPEKDTYEQIPISELDDYKVIDAKYENHILVIIGAKKGHYDRFVVRFSPDFKSYDIRIVKDISYNGISFTVNEKGVCVLLTEDEHLEVFFIQPNSDIRVVEDNNISGDMKLYSRGKYILFSRDQFLYRISMR